MRLSKSKLLIVDDTEENIDVLAEALENDYDLSVAMDGKRALESVKIELPDIILLDIMMPGMNGYEVCKILKSDVRTKEIPIIFLTALAQDQDEAEGLLLGAVDYITKPFNPEIVKVRVRNHLLLKMHQDNLEELVKKRTMQLELTQDVLIKSMGILAEYRDPESSGHINRTQNYIGILANHADIQEKYKSILDKKTIDLLCKSAPLHDIGKVGVRDSILFKPGKLTEEEFDEMKKHVTYGKEAIAAAQKDLGEESFLRYAEEIAYTHHEKWNGSGYPLGLEGENIPISGRLMAVADVYDALISKRVYKPPFTHNKAKIIIQEGKGSHFDPDLVDAFMDLEDEFRKTALKFADYEEEREKLRI